MKAGELLKALQNASADTEVSVVFASSRSTRVIRGVDMGAVKFSRALKPSEIDAEDFGTINLLLFI